MRGEQPVTAKKYAQDIGSPPHARGAAGPASGISSVGGITPACAGSSGEQPVRDSASWDHPRMRGEQAISYAAHMCYKGSPPHARGADKSGTSGSSRQRITPACAGSRHGSKIPDSVSWDHPRMRGEQQG